MADSSSFPQIPSTVWVGVWKILHDSPSRRLDENVLSIELGVQKTAARQYLKELGRLGLFNAEGVATDLAKKWRQDGDDPQVIQELLEHAYPEELRELAPVDRLDRDKIVRWFVSKGLGGGAAQNKAATYLRIAAGVSASNGGNNGKPERAFSKAVASTPRNRPSRTEADRQEISKDKRGGGEDGGGLGRATAQPDLHVNIQIHISADSSPDQIDAIFSAMKRYFNGPASK